jgi:hypothetical protein
VAELGFSLWTLDAVARFDVVAAFYLAGQRIVRSLISRVVGFAWRIAMSAEWKLVRCLLARDFGVFEVDRVEIETIVKQLRCCVDLAWWMVTQVQVEVQGRVKARGHVKTIAPSPRCPRSSS